MAEIHNIRINFSTDRTIPRFQQAADNLASENQKFANNLNRLESSLSQPRAVQSVAQQSTASRLGEALGFATGLRSATNIGTAIGKRQVLTSLGRKALRLNDLNLKGRVTSMERLQQVFKTTSTRRGIVDPSAETRIMRKPSGKSKIIKDVESKRGVSPASLKLGRESTKIPAPRKVGRESTIVAPPPVRSTGVTSKIKPAEMTNKQLGQSLRQRQEAFRAKPLSEKRDIFLERVQEKINLQGEVRRGILPRGETRSVEELNDILEAEIRSDLRNLNLMNKKIQANENTLGGE